MAARGSGYRLVVVAVDFSKAADAAFREAARLSKQLGARLVAVHAVAHLKPTLPNSLPSRRLVSQLQAELNREAESRLREYVAGTEAEFEVLSGLPHKAILRFAADRAANLIVIGKHGGNIAERLLIGSTADRVARKAKVPVLLVPA